jgi:putative CocE/NonD family hydrolase
MNVATADRFLRIAVAILLMLVVDRFSASAANGQGLEQVKASYTKYEYQIPMRDGQRLFTAVFLPKDQSKTYPILMTRTPYSLKPYGADQYRENLGPSALFGKAGYIFVYQDVRGRWMSEGEFVDMRPHRAVKRDAKEVDESTDTWDTIDWLVKNLPNHNGKVGTWGISYPGFYTSAGMIDAHPALVACSPQAPIVDWFVGDDWHHNGALQLPHAFNFMAKNGHPRPKPTKKIDHPFDHESVDGYEFFLRMGPLPNADAVYYKGDVPFWNEVMRHGNYDDFWKTRNLRPHLNQIHPAVMTVGGWFDAENLFGALETYKQIEVNSPMTTNLLVMGPWVHGGWSRGDGEYLGHIPFNAKTAAYYREQIELPFFEFYLKGEGKLPNPEAWVFETGTNVWRQYATWPPANFAPKSLYLHPNGQLLADPPKDTDRNAAYDEYPSDPSKPVPYFDKISIGMAPEYMTADQRFASTRPDVLVYQTEVLENDASVAGPIDVELHVSTTGTDSDWVVKLIDVYPHDYPDPKENPTQVKMGGYQQLIRGDVFRGKFRSSFEKPEPFVPNQPTVIKFRIPDTCHVFRPGHRLMVQIQSSWFPLIDRNPQTFVDIYTAKPADFQKATQRIYRTATMPSRIILSMQQTGTFPPVATKP